MLAAVKCLTGHYRHMRNTNDVQASGATAIIDLLAFAVIKSCVGRAVPYSGSLGPDSVGWKTSAVLRGGGHNAAERSRLASLNDILALAGPRGVAWEVNFP